MWRLHIAHSWVSASACLRSCVDGREASRADRGVQALEQPLGQRRLGHVGVLLPPSGCLSFGGVGLALGFPQFGYRLRHVGLSVPTTRMRAASIWSSPGTLSGSSSSSSSCLTYSSSCCRCSTTFWTGGFAGPLAGCPGVPWLRAWACLRAAWQAIDVRAHGTPMNTCKRR